MSKVLAIILAFGCVFVYSQFVNNVRLVDHRGYMTNVLIEIAKSLEEREWCNLKIPDFEMDVDNVVFGENVTGRVLFKKGFAVSINRLDVLESSLNQIWTWNNNDATGTVEIRGTLRMHDLTIGLEVESHLNDLVYHSSATFLHPLITYAFSIFRNTQSHEMYITVTGTHPRVTSRLNFLPANNITSIVRTLYDGNSTFNAITSWGSEVMEPIAMDVITNRIPFPVICYDCPIT